MVQTLCRIFSKSVCCLIITHSTFKHIQPMPRGVIFDWFWRSGLLIHECYSIVNTLYQDCSLTSVRSQNYSKVPRKLIDVTYISISTETRISKSVAKLFQSTKPKVPWNPLYRAFHRIRLVETNKVVGSTVVTQTWSCAANLWSALEQGCGKCLCQYQYVEESQI